MRRKDAIQSEAFTMQVSAASLVPLESRWIPADKGTEADVAVERRDSQLAHTGFHEK